MAWLVAICIAISIVASLALVPLVRFCARRLGIVDRPDSERKLHSEPVALGGGLAIYLTLVITFVSMIWIDRAFFVAEAVDANETVELVETIDPTGTFEHAEAGELGYVTSNYYTLFGAAACLLLVGLIDDGWALRGRQKLLLQCLILCALVGGGTLIKQINLFGVDVELGVFAFPVTVAWLLLAVNALNLIDGADGMATTAGCIISTGLGIIGLCSGSFLTAVIAFSLAAALLTFLVFNRPPASIYLGDAGSMTIGLFVGVLAVWSSVKESTVLASAPIAILAIPLFDSTAAILRRWLTGRSIYTTDRAHLHHLLQEKLGPIRMLLVVAGLCITTTSLAVLSVVFNQPWLAGLGVVMVTALLILTRSFGHAEAKLLFGRALHFVQSFATTPATSESENHHSRVALQGEEKWDTIWEPLVDFARRHCVVQIKIDLNLAWLHEGYHATWQSVRLPEKPLQLQISVPLFAHRPSDGSRVPIGRLDMVGSADDPKVYSRIGDLSDHLHDLAPEIDRVVERLELARKCKQARIPSEASERPLTRPAVDRSNLPIDSELAVSTSPSAYSKL